MTCTSTAMRYIDMLLALPVGQWTTTASVHKHLASLGYRVSRRTVERDMRKLAEPFGVEMRPGHCVCPAPPPGCEVDSMKRRGLGMECPEQIVVLLREAGWQGYNGWWMHQAKNGPRCRWYEAVAAEMRGDTSSRKRKADVEQQPTESCPWTVDMFSPEQRVLM